MIFAKYAFRVRKFYGKDLAENTTQRLLDNLHIAGCPVYIETISVCPLSVITLILVVPLIVHFHYREHVVLYLCY